MSVKRNCANCNLAFMVDDGYSNYTVEGTTFYCGVAAHPDGHFDRFYNTEGRLDYAEKCPHFFEGDAFHVDVDRDCWDEKVPLATRILWQRLKEKNNI